MKASCKEFGNDGGEAGGEIPMWDCGTPLYDAHELVSLAYTIERHMMVWPHLHDGSKPNPKPMIITTTQFYDPEEASSPKTSVTKGSSVVSSLNEFFMRIQKMKIRQRMKKKHKKMKACFMMDRIAY